MKVVLQRVAESRVSVDGEIKGRIGCGLLVLVGVAPGDTEDECRKMARKIVAMRIFNDKDGKMNLSVRDVNGELLVISQFTIMASTRHGNRPSYIGAAAPREAEPMYELFCRELGELCGRPVQKGVFGADMRVELVNSGPVTIILDSRNA